MSRLLHAVPRRWRGAVLPLAGLLLWTLAWAEIGRAHV